MGVDRGAIWGDIEALEWRPGIMESIRTILAAVVIFHWHVKKLLLTYLEEPSPDQLIERELDERRPVFSRIPRLMVDSATVGARRGTSAGDYSISLLRADSWRLCGLLSVFGDANGGGPLSRRTTPIDLGNC